MAHALPCCHDKPRSFEGNLITELPAQIFEKNVNLDWLYVPVGLRACPLAEREALPCTILPFKRARCRSMTDGKAMRVHRGNPLRVCILLVRPKTSC